MEKIKVEIEIPKPPDGWVFDGFRKVKAGEMAFCYEDWIDCVIEEGEQYPVAIKAKQYREPVLPADWGELCEFSQDELYWVSAELDGYHRGKWITKSLQEYLLCRIEVSE